MGKFSTFAQYFASLTRLILKILIKSLDFCSTLCTSDIMRKMFQEQLLQDLKKKYSSGSIRD